MIRDFSGPSDLLFQQGDKVNKGRCVFFWENVFRCVSVCFVCFAGVSVCFWLCPVRVLVVSVLCPRCVCDFLDGEEIAEKGRLGLLRRIGRKIALNGDIGLGAVGVLNCDSSKSIRLALVIAGEVGVGAELMLYCRILFQ